MYPVIQPYHKNFLQVDARHHIYFEEVGNPRGYPVVFVHGGPGGGVFPNCRRFFDPRHYRIILFDQRGSGQSRPYADLVDNTTPNLIGDMEVLREYLNIEQWMVFGGSWGSTLSLAYAIEHPDRVRALILRGIFLARQEEIDWLYGPNGAARMFPAEYARFMSILSPEERITPVESYYKYLTDDDELVQLKAAWEWDIWESSISQLIPYQRDWDNTSPEDWQASLAIARIESHYFVNQSFLPYENQLLDGAKTLGHIPTTIVNGRYDVICPCKTAYELAEAMPHADFIIVPDTGHSSMEQGTSDVLTQVMDQYRRLQ
jgi:proline iminopeptidase